MTIINYYKSVKTLSIGSFGKCLKSNKLFSIYHFHFLLLSTQNYEIKSKQEIPTMSCMCP